MNHPLPPNFPPPVQPLSPGTRQRLELLFAKEDQFKAETMLVNECGTNLAFCQQSNMYELERLRFAAMKVSGGNLDALGKAIALAKQDWRDLSMSAGFGFDVNLHKFWLAEEIKK